VGFLGDRSGQYDGAILGLDLDGIILEVGFEHIGLADGGLDAVVRLGRAQGCAID
jgi:hypothetical protein